MKKICFITGTRAEYGLLSSLMRAIKDDNRFILQIIATNMHLSSEYGNTYKEIESDGFVINRKVENLLSSDTGTGITKSTGLAMIGLADAINDLHPDLIIILGDRYETMAAALSSLLLKIPVAHLHGGEITEGAFDDSLRHSITKMCHLHFVSTEEYRARVIQLGEKPDRVYNVGAIGIDNIKKLELLNQNELIKQLKLKFNKRNVLVTFHPETLEKKSSETQFKQLLEALDELNETNIFFTKPNSDSDSRAIITLIDNYVQDNKEKAFAYTSLGQLKYLSLLKYIDAVIGNSSSGIIEAPSFNIGTVNIGGRQKGRISANSVIHCEMNKESIASAFNTLFSKGFQKQLKTVKNPYGQGNTTEKIVEIIAAIKLDDIVKKQFFNIDADYFKNVHHGKE